MYGHLVLVVGPSGAGKDSVLRGAAQTFKDDPKYVFPRRIITRVANVAAEDHDSLAQHDFEILRNAGGFLLSWNAHGNCYGIPISITDQLKKGRIVSINVSRQIVADAAVMFANLAVVEITADRELRLNRIAERGREVADGAIRRAMREVSPYPPGLKITRIENNGSLTKAIDYFVNVLRNL